MLRNDVDIESILQTDHRIRECIEFNGKFNKTSRFIMPLLEISSGGKLTSMFLKGAFMDDYSIEHDFTRPVFLLFSVKNQRDRGWQELCKQLNARRDYIMDYYVGEQDNSSLIMYVLELAPKWGDDYELFKQGRYSKMSEQYKAKFPKTIYSASGVAKEGREWGILHKSDILKNEVVKLFINPGTSNAEDVIRFRRDMDDWNEVWDAPHEEHETYHYDPDIATNRKAREALQVHA